MHEVDSYQKRFLHGSECTLSFVKPFASFSCEKARAWLLQLPLSFLMQYVKGLQIWTLWIFAICIVSCQNISLVHHVLILSRSLDLTHHKLMRTRTYVKLHCRCLFSCRQVGSIYLMQGEFAESIFFLIPRSWSGAWPNFVYVDNFWKRKEWNGQSLILAYYYVFQHKIVS